MMIIMKKNQKKMGKTKEQKPFDSQPPLSAESHHVCTSTDEQRTPCFRQNFSPID